MIGHRICGVVEVYRVIQVFSCAYIFPVNNLRNDYGGNDALGIIGIAADLQAVPCGVIDNNGVIEYCSRRCARIHLYRNIEHVRASRY